MDMLKSAANTLAKNAPLANHMRPRTLDEFFGQDHIIGPGRLLRRAIQIDQLSSLIFYGPPGTGKTTLARIIAHTTKAQFLFDQRGARRSMKTSATPSTARNRPFLCPASGRYLHERGAPLQQGAAGRLLPTLKTACRYYPYRRNHRKPVLRSEQGARVALADFPTQNAHRAICEPWRCRRFQQGARLRRPRRVGSKMMRWTVCAPQTGTLAGCSTRLNSPLKPRSGQGRHHPDYQGGREESIQQKAVLYDKDGDAHYDTISAFIKSVRGSDPDAALYWMAKMVYAGETRASFSGACSSSPARSRSCRPAGAFGGDGRDPRLRLCRTPEGRYHLAHACLYLATAPKSNSSMAFSTPRFRVRRKPEDDVPGHCRIPHATRRGSGMAKDTSIRMRSATTGWRSNISRRRCRGNCFTNRRTWDMRRESGCASRASARQWFRPWRATTTFWKTAGGSAEVSPSAPRLWAEPDTNRRHAVRYTRQDLRLRAGASGQSGPRPSYPHRAPHV